MGKNNSSTPKQKNVCERLLLAIRSPSPFRSDASVARTSPFSNVYLTNDRCARVSKIDNTKEKTESNNQAKPNKVMLPASNKGQEKVNIVLPIYGNENRIASIGESGQIKPGAAASINRMFSEYIHRTKHKFNAPSIVENASFKEGSQEVKNAIRYYY